VVSAPLASVAYPCRRWPTPIQYPISRAAGPARRWSPVLPTMSSPLKIPRTLSPPCPFLTFSGCGPPVHRRLGFRPPPTTSMDEGAPGRRRWLRSARARQLRSTGASRVSASGGMKEGQSAQRNNASIERSTSRSSVAQSETDMRMSRIPSQVVPLKKAVPSAWMRLITRSARAS